MLNQPIHATHSDVVVVGGRTFDSLAAGGRGFRVSNNITGGGGAHPFTSARDW